MARQMLILFAVLIGIMLWFSGCATTGQSYQEEEPAGDVSDIDQLLGLGDEKQSADTQDDDRINEDDVLKLLGVVDEEPIQTTQEARLQTELEQLQTEDSNLAVKENDLNQKIQQQQNIINNRGTAGFSGSTETFASRYQRAYQTYLQHDYQNAIQQFEALLKENPRHSLSDNCQYWIGECYYGMAKYMQALIAFQKVFTFTQSNKDADAQLKIGICHMQLKDNEKARQELQKLIDNYPNSQYVSVAKRYLDSLN